MNLDLIVPRNEGPGGSNEILVGDGSKWELCAQGRRVLGPSEGVLGMPR